jgi:DNA-binding response OmpR family regulator
MKRRILLVDDEVAVLLTMKAVLEISGFDVDTAASAREGKSRLKTRTYDMVITDMRMESEESGREVIVAARTAPYHPAVALLTAFPVAEDDWQNMGADKMLVKPMQTRALIQQIEKLLETHLTKLKKLESGGVAAGLAAGFAAGIAAGAVTQVTPAKTVAAKTVAAKAVAAKATGAKRATVVKKAGVKKAGVKKAVVATKVPPAKKSVTKQAAKKTAKKASPRKTAAK